MNTLKLLKRIEWAESLPMILIHIGSLGILFYPFEWKWVALCAGLYFVRMFAITAGYHRYFAHRAYKTNRVVQFCLAFLGGTAAQKGALWWAAHHRHHHRFSDQSNDVHSPVKHGFLYSHIGWILTPDHTHTRREVIQDLTKFPELVWLNRYHVVPVAVLAVGLHALGGMPALFWGGFLSTTLLWHGTFFINSLAHVFGSVRYETGDASRNNGWLALITLGEGWHNNHHCYPSAARQGFFWWELDVSYLILKAMNALGLVRELRQPPLQKLEEKRVDIAPVATLPSQAAAPAAATAR